MTRPEVISTVESTKDEIIDNEPDKYAAAA